MGIIDHTGHDDPVERFKIILNLLMVNLGNFNENKQFEAMLALPKEMTEVLPQEVVAEHTGDKVIIEEL